MFEHKRNCFLFGVIIQERVTLYLRSYKITIQETCSQVLILQMYCLQKVKTEQGKSVLFWCSHTKHVFKRSELKTVNIRNYDNSRI